MHVLMFDGRQYLSLQKYWKLAKAKHAVDIADVDAAEEFVLLSPDNPY